MKTLKPRRLTRAQRELLVAAVQMLAVLRANFRISCMPEHKARPFNLAYAALEVAIVKALAAEGEK